MYFNGFQVSLIYFNQLSVNIAYSEFVDLTSFATAMKYAYVFEQIDKLIQANRLAYLSKSMSLNMPIDTRQPARPKPGAGATF